MNRFFRNINIDKIALWKKSVLALVLACLLGLAWNKSYLLWFVFFCFGGVLRLLDGDEKNWEKIFLILFPFLLAWNISTLWWVWFASPGGAVAMILANSILLTPTFAVYFFSRNHRLRWLPYGLWICASLSLEFIHYNWEGNFPWLNVGNLFSHSPLLIQWISYTGVAGVSLWILVVNALFHWCWKHHQWTIKTGTLLTLFILLPMLSSAIWRWSNHEFDKEHFPQQQILILQPNIDTYTQKFSGIRPWEQIEEFLHASMTAQQKLDSTIPTLWLWPETCIPEGIPTQRLEEHPILQHLKSYLVTHRHISLLTGAFLIQHMSPTKRKFYNVALFLNPQLSIGIHVKSKLVPGSETIPYHKQLQFLDRFIINLGGIVGTLEVDTTKVIFKSVHSAGTFSSVVCYESVFGEYVSEYIKKGSRLIALITNDDWWGNTPGHIQHFNYGRLRAIENRRYIARSANTGISAVINAYGEIESIPLLYKKKGTITASVPLITYQTFYTSHGDYIYRIAACLLVVLLLWPWLMKRKS